jgi:uncharacterized protein YdaU (DUF1376 family)
MSGVAYIRFFGDDWLSGTQALSLEERGALVTIVALTAATGQAPELDYPRLARRLGCTQGRAKKIIAALADLGKINIENGVVENERALFETEFSQKKSKKQSENASARWTKSAKKSNKNNGCIDATAMRRECQPEPEPEPNNLGEPNGSPPEPTSGGLSSAQPVNVNAEAVAEYNRVAGEAGWPRVQKMTPTRSKALGARLRDCGGIDGWRHAIQSAAESDFLCGRSPRPWTGFGFDWLIKSQNFTKLMEGNYANRDHHNHSSTPPISGRGPGGPGHGTAAAFAAVAERMSRGA